MDDQVKKPLLNEIEEQELHEGQKLYEMTQSEGFQIMKRWLEDLAFHSWTDPREATSKEDWLWREENAFHAANNARELLEKVQKAISQSEYLAKKKAGEIMTKSMRIQ